MRNESKKFTQRHYELFARLIAESYADFKRTDGAYANFDGIKLVEDKLIAEFVADNPKFKRDLFEKRVAEWREAFGNKGVQS